MLPLVCLDHKILSVSETFLPAASAALFYGRGVFTTLAVSEKKAFQWPLHWTRLKTDAARLKLDLSAFEEAEIIAALEATLDANRLHGGRSRIAFFQQGLRGVWNAPPENKVSFLIVAAEKRFPKNDLRLVLSPFPVNSRSPLAGVKSCNYLENLLALERAADEKFDEAVRLNERGEIVSACMANIFWVVNGEIFTPRLDAGGLDGTTRRFVAEHFSVCEKPAGIENLIEADEVFLTSAGMGAARAASFGEKKYLETATFERIRESLAPIFPV